jgi:hypothetical protein
MVIHRTPSRPAPVAPIKIRVEPGNREIEGGETVSIRAYVAGTLRHPKLLTRSGDEWKDASLDPAQAAEGARSGEHVYAATLRNVKEDVTYKIKVADQETPIFALSVRDLPRATGYHIRYDYPAYTGLKSEEAQAITADLADTGALRDRDRVGTNRAVDDATILFDRGSQIAGSGGDHGARLTVPIRETAASRSVSPTAADAARCSVRLSCAPFPTVRRPSPFSRRVPWMTWRTT